MDGYGWVMEGAEARVDAVALFLLDAAQELQGDVPGFGRGPAKSVLGGLVADGDCGELVDERGWERDG